MDDWVWWMIAAAVLAVGEIATLGLLPRADRDRGGAGRDRGGWPAAGSPLQWIVFVAASLGAVAASSGRSRAGT